MVDFSTFPDHYGINFTKNIHRDVYASIDPSQIQLAKGYTVVVTGASYGIGEHIAKSFARAGATNIVLVARTASELERVKADIISSEQKSDINISIIVGDATKPETYDQIHDLLTSTYASRLDCLVCNAGLGRFKLASWSRKLHETDLEDFQAGTQLNYLSAYYASRRLIPLLLNSQGQGKTLINMVSLGAHFVDLPAYLYNIAKLAMTRLTETTAAAYRDEGLNAFALHPGSVWTPGAKADSPDQSMESVCQDSPGLAAAFCCWLAKEQPAWLSGRYLSATWDVDDLVAMKEDIVKGDKLKFKMVI